MTTPQVIREGNVWKMIYSIRSKSKEYRMGYAESEDDIHFVRKDNLMDIDVFEDGFDNEMICFGKCIKYQDKVYRFYSGNHYEIGGLGYAVLMQ